MQNPIGIFDSGIGGISILENLKKILPKENFIYLADNKNCPYGSKTKEEIFLLSKKNCYKLIELNCKIIIIACNTSTTNSIQKLREIISIPIIGIEPGLKPAINYTKTKNIGVLATEKTLESRLFFETLLKNKTDDIIIHEQIGYDLVNIIEEGSYSKKNISKILKSYLAPMINKNIDCLLLGCTHFNHVKDIIKEIVSDRVTIIDTIEPVNKQILSKLKSNNILNKSNIKRFIKIFYNGSKLSQNFHDKEYNLNYLKF
tara:strand:+ start:1344 stop:2120 length:777 start_codon:yes stop_codon:yes gene_type:complete